MEIRKCKLPRFWQQCCRVRWLSGTSTGQGEPIIEFSQGCSGWLYTHSWLKSKVWYRVTLTDYSTPSHHLPCRYVLGNPVVDLQIFCDWDLAQNAQGSFLLSQQQSIDNFETLAGLSTCWRDQRLPTEGFCKWKAR